MAITLANDNVGVFPGARSRQGWVRREGELVSRLTQLREAVFCAVGAGTVLPRVEWDGPWRSAEVVATLVHFCLERLRRTQSSRVHDADRLCRLILELQQLAMDLYVYDTSLRGQRLADCAAGLSRLRAIPDTTALLDLACEEIVLRCGFHRAVLSRVEGKSWRPWMGYFGDEQHAGSWFTEWIDQSIPLDSHTPEAQLLTNRRPSLVYDTANTPVYRPIIVDAGHSRSYVVAPLVHGEDVVGFLHADHHPMSRRTDEGDRDVLWAFADGFSHIYERTVLLERLRVQRDQVRELVTAAVDRMDDLCESGIVLAGACGRESGEGAAGQSPNGAVELTAREADVFQLMIEGATNRSIAEKLVITEGTVKSHVKHILRKYGAANRAQAVAWAIQGRVE